MQNKLKYLHCTTCPNYESNSESAKQLLFNLPIITVKPAEPVRPFHVAIEPQFVTPTRIRENGLIIIGFAMSIWWPWTSWSTCMLVEFVSNFSASHELESVENFVPSTSIWGGVKAQNYRRFLYGEILPFLRFLRTLYQHHCKMWRFRDSNSGPVLSFCGDKINSQYTILSN